MQTNHLCWNQLSATFKESKWLAMTMTLTVTVTMKMKTKAKRKMT